jgi:hypothetical protein
MLKCENVTKQFGELVAVYDVSFEVEKGMTWESLHYTLVMMGRLRWRNKR